MAPAAEVTGISGTGYEPPRLEMFGSLAEVTKAMVAGIFVDKPGLPQGSIIFGNTSL